MNSLNIPQKRFILYALLLLVVPHFFLLNYFYDRKEALDSAQKEAEQLENLIYRQLQKGAFNEVLVKTYKGTNTRQREKLLEASMRAKFIEGKADKKGPLQEVAVQLAAPLVLNSTELKELLSLFEDKAIAPYIAKTFPALSLITDISLQRTFVEDKEQMIVNLKLLKREFA